MKKKRRVKFDTKKVVSFSVSFFLFVLGLSTYVKSYSEFVSTLEPESTGISNNTVYVNDLFADYDYFKGLNYTEIRDTNIPSGTSRGYYDDEYLVKVEIIYDGKDINNSSLVGSVSPINNETSNKYVYYKYFALERNSNGTLATNSNGDNYIKVELIDNPFSKRPYVDGVEYGFNGWVCNQGEDTTSGVCANTTMYFNKTNYTRYMEIACDGEDEFTIHLNASWYEADVATSTTEASNFNSMSMQPLRHSVTVYENRHAKAVWKQNYATMVFTRTYVRSDGYMPAGIWYKTDPDSNSYTYVRYNNYTRCRNGQTCYAYTSNTSGIIGGTDYNGETVEFVPNYYASTGNTSVTISTYNSNYMNLVEDPDGTYTIQVPVTYYSFDLNAGDKTSGFFYQVSNPTSTMISTREYYNSDGSLCTNANNCRTAYKLINYNDSVNNSNGHTIYQIEESNGDIVDQDLYYYLVTRDTNIFRYTSSSNNGLNMSSLQINRPFTVTGAAVNGTTAAGVLNIYNSNLTVANDLAIENIRIYGPNTAGTSNTELGNNTRTSYTIYANSHNLKIGRNITSSRNSNYLTAYTIMGGTNSAGGSGTFRVIVESGRYYAYHSGAMSGSSNYTLNETTIFGSDYDRVTTTNNNLRFIIGLDGYAGGHNTAGSASLFASFNTVKSGMFGYNSDGSANTDNTAGLYVGGRASTCVNSITGLKIEGGQINTVVGGYGYNGTTTTNSTYIGMSGGAVRSIYGGAGHSTTKGNRIINVTGGTVQFGVLGGSDSNSTTDTSDGVVQGSTLVYVGGTVIVGDGSNNTLYGVESGSVYGAGGGRSGYDAKGTVYNSHVIINGGTIRRSVYGGGNYGSTGTQYAGTSSTVIDILSGNIGEVYGGSKAAGFSQNNYKGTSIIDINMSDGTVGYIYGGSNEQGIVYGSIDIDITGGSVTNNVYGGGKGSNTFVTNNISVDIGTSGVAGTPTIGGNIYGGSALGTVNSNTATGTASGNTSVTVNNGSITGSVFGGGEGDNSNTPYVRGNVTVNVNGGNISNVYGGNDQKGTPNGTIEVRINGGSVGNTFGGGNLAPINTSTVYLTGGSSTNIYGGGNEATASTTSVQLQGGTATNVFGGGNKAGITTSTTVNLSESTVTGAIYGGSNESGNVTISNITTTSGSVGTIYGGNNLGGNTGTSNVTIGGGTITDVYGGGNEAETGVTRVYLNGSSPTNVYGGGNKAGITTSTSVTLNGSTVTNIYGGSNQSGTVPSSTITSTSGSAVTIYGGNNLGGSTTASHITINNGNINTIFGGGNEAETGTTSIGLNGGTIINVYGGGNKAGITTSTTTTLNGSTVTSIFGGSNQSGTVPSSTINTTLGSVGTIYGGNNLGGSTTDTHINVNGANIGTIYGGGNEAETGSTNLVINAWSIDNVYGGGNLAAVNTSLVTLQSGYIGNVYGGGNQAGVTTSTTVNLSGASSSNIYGGSNQSGVVTQSNINVSSGNATTIYGGNNLGGSTTTANVTVTGGNITYVYGGGNVADTGTTNVSLSNATIGDVYGGGNQASVTSSNVTVGGGARISNLFGGSNTQGTVNTGRIIIPFNGSAPTITNIYGGNNQGGQTNNAYINISCGVIDFIYGGGNYATTGSTNTSISGATVNRSIFGGGNQAAVTNNAILNITNSRVSENVYGGGNLGTIGGNTTVNVTDAILGRSLFAGGNGHSAAVYGNTLLNVGGATTVARHVFGGGNAAPTGTEESNNSTSVVNIAGLTTGGNVYGGANTSVLYGTVTVNIGQNAVSNTVTSGNIHIGGTVFGGGEANEAGSEIYDFSFISVTEGITINLNAQGHNTFDIDGSIFGSGNASSTSGFSSVNIRNYGSGANYKKNVSIQRASLVTLDNSSIELHGATDRTNEYSDVLFSLSRLDEIKLLNNSTLYLETGTNLVKKFTSGVVVNGSERKATVTIDSDGDVTKNVNNRLFIYEGKNINIATTENITASGEVSGKVFTALYNTNYDKNSTIPSSEIVYFTKGSYVLGLHKTNHNYEQDGFYSNFAREDTIDKIDVKYIVPTPEDSNYYIWAIGEQVTAYEITLTASKYSTLGTYELPLINFSDANTTFSVLGFNYSELDSEVDLVDKSEISRIASSGTVADHKMSLVMKSSDNGWITIGKTTFLSNEQYFSGTTNYVGENSNIVPTFLFYLYHSKNLETSGDMGTVTISLVAITAIDDLNNEVKRININVNLNRAIYTTNDYEGTITQGKVYEMFAPSTVNITSTSAFTTYYSLFVESNESIYRNGYHRVLASTYNFPANTKITMIDLLSGSTPEYYYYVVTDSDYQTKQAELLNQGDVSYELSKFLKMGSSNVNNHYDDVAKNALYYDSTNHYAEEEFIFIVDFKESGIEEDVLEKSLLLELRSSDDEVILSVIGVEQQQLFYNLYANKDSIIDVEANMSSNDVYIGERVNVNVYTNFVQQTISSTPIIDTNFYDYKSGIKISILDSNDNVVNGPSLMGLSYTIGNTTYYPRFDGTTRINVAERIANVSTRIVINTEGSNLASGNYKLLIESFASPDGIYYGLTSSDSVTIPFVVKNTIYGLMLTASDSELVIDKTTGLNDNKTNTMTFNIDYSSGLLNPNLRVSLYRRNYDEIYSNNYTLVDFKDYFSDNLDETNLENVYMLFNPPTSQMTKTFHLKDNLTSGTYKVVFALYDNNTHIGNVYKYIVIK